MRPETAIKLLKGHQNTLAGLISRLRDAGSSARVGEDDEKLYRHVAMELKDFVADQLMDRRATSFQLVRLFNQSVDGAGGRPTISGIEAFSKAVDNLVSRVENSPIILRAALDHDEPRSDDKLDPIRRIAERFHLVARQLKDRHEGRPTLNVEDEHDLQDLFRALLMLHCDEIRREKWQPAYANGGTVVDYFLPFASTIVEIRPVREGVDQEEMRRQLLVDIDKYKHHAGCRWVFCVVYDPQARITDPQAVESDLSDSHGHVEVIVSIVPKRRLLASG